MRRRTAVLLLPWLAGVVAVPWWAAELDRWTFAGVPLGYWCSSTGLLLGFVLLCGLAVRLMEAAEAEAAHGQAVPDSSAPAPATTAVEARQDR